MDRDIIKEEGLNSVKSELDNKTGVDRNLSVSNLAKRQHIKDEDMKDESKPKRQKIEQKGDGLDIKKEDLEDAKSVDQAGPSNKSETTLDVKFKDAAEVDIKWENVLTLNSAYKDEDKMVDVKPDCLSDLPNESSSYIPKRDNVDIKVEDVQDTVVQSIEEARHSGIKTSNNPVFKVESSEDIYNDSTRGSRVKSSATPYSYPSIHQMRWRCSDDQGRIIAPLRRFPVALSSPEESPTTGGGKPSTQPTPNFSTLSSPGPNPDSSDESRSSDSGSDGYDADVSENSSFWESNSEHSDHSTGSNSSNDFDTPASSTRSSLSQESSPIIDDATMLPSPAPASVPYVSPFTAPRLFFRDFYPTPVARRSEAAGPKIRFYRKNFFNRPAMIPLSRS